MAAHGFAVLPLYALLAMHRVYAGSWLAAIARAVAVAVLYVAALAAAMVGLGIGSVLGA